jgi:aminoglycoside phosphotransferase (APT) family kinase protein
MREPMRVLSGGLGNLNIRIGDHRVLRIHQRDPRSVDKEAHLLRRGWRSFRVPSLLDRGEDFLVLEYVAHGPLLGTAEHGAAVGEALAEIHGVKVDTCGFLDSELAVVEPLPNWIAALEEHVTGCFDGDCIEFGDLKEPVLAVYAQHRAELESLAARAVLQHGDFKPSNLHWTTTGQLLVLDWEFAFAGPPLMDVGQLIRWSVPESFRDAFATQYVAHGGALPERWSEHAAVFDLANLVGLLARTDPGSRRARDVRARIQATIARER